MHLIGSSNNSIAQNIIAYNGTVGELESVGDGIRIESDAELTLVRATGNVMSANSIHSNVGLGIDLMFTDGSEEGPTANDLDDKDLGANNLQNTPVIDSTSFTIDSEEL